MHVDRHTVINLETARECAVRLYLELIYLKQSDI